WLNLNSFVARLFGSGAIVWGDFPIWQLRQGLENDLAEVKGDCSPAEAVDNGVAVASSWLTHPGLALLELSRRSLAQVCSRGSSLPGHLGFSLERWGFWKRRLGELRSTVSMGVAPSVEQAIEIMRWSVVALAEN
ncbi:hypothetical protein B0T25DRAFT_458142, partial [Lasiosphaeria hispida]